MQKTSIPAKFLVPWAQNDTAKVEIPVTTTDPTRASQSLGFPPLTEQPPEVGGVPPQGEDFNGGMNQIARAIWWMLQGGGFPYDSAFANASQIGGYINSAVIPRADGVGYWLSTADNNKTNPDATDGTAANWAPLGVYGTASISVSSTDVTVYPVQAAFQTLLLSGTLTANRNVILPAWAYEWKIIDNTVRGGFTLTVKTATGSGVAIQTGSQLVRGDGTNIVQNPQSIAPATAPTQAAQLSQVLQHGQCRLALSGSNLVLTPYNGNKLIINGAAQVIPSAGVSLAPTGLTASTLYYIYASVSGGALVLTASTTGHATDGSTGVEIMSGNAAYTLVGMAYVVAGPAFADSSAQRYVRSWFNDPGVDGVNWFTANRAVTSTTYVEINSEIRVNFIAWADDIVTLGGSGVSSQNTAGDLNSTVGAIDGTIEIGTYSMGYIAGGTGAFPFTICKPRKGLSEGLHYYTLFGKVSGGVGTYSGGTVTTSNPDGCTLTFSAKH